MISSMKFDDNFNGSTFQRNNRSTGQKSLRCFPRCCEHGHKPQGFCGQPIYATAVLQKTSVSFDKILIVGEIRPEAEPGLANDVGTKLTKVEFNNRIRSESNHPKHNQILGIGPAELLLGTIHLSDETPETYTVRIVLNEPLHSYDYGWTSSRFKSGTAKHVVDIIVLSDDDGSTVTVLDSVCSSDSFVITSTKKPTAKKGGEVVPLTGQKRKGDSDSLLPFGPFDDDDDDDNGEDQINFLWPLSSLSYCVAVEASPTTSPKRKVPMPTTNVAFKEIDAETIRRMKEESELSSPRDKSTMKRKQPKKLDC